MHKYKIISFNRSAYGLCILLLLVCTSCSYEFGQDYFLELEQLEPSATFELNLNSNEVLRNSRNIEFVFNSNNIHRLFGIEIFIDGQPEYFTNDPTGSFLLDINKLQGEEHILKVIFQFSSGTGSIADANNLEVYQAEQEYTFKTDKSLPKDITLSSIEIINGKPILDWELSKDSNFESGYLTIYTFGYFFKKIVLTREEIESLSFLDNNTTQLDISYSLTLSNYYGETTSNTLGKTLPPPKISVDIINENSYQFSYTQHPLYGNFDELSFNINSRFNDRFNKNGGSFIVNESLIFGQENYIQILLYKNGSDAWIDNLEVKYFLGNEMSLKQINSITFDKVSNAYYALQLIGDSYYNASLDLIIYKLDPEDFSIISSNKLKTVRNTTGDLIVQKNQLLVSTNSEILFVDLNNLTITETLKTPDSETTYQGYRSFYRNGTIIRYFSRGLIEIYDAKNSKLIKSFTTDYRFFFSDDGKNFINGDKLYSLINQKVEFVESLNNGTQLHYADFIPESNQVIYGNFYSDKRSIVYNVDSGTRSYLDLATEISYINYDSSSNKVYVHQNDNSQDYPEKIIVYDFNTSTKKSLNCAETQHGRSFEFINNVIISNNGIYLDGYF